MRGEGLTRWTESWLEAGVVAVAGGVGVDLMGEGVAESMAWSLRNEQSLRDEPWRDQKTAAQENKVDLRQ